MSENDEPTTLFGMPVVLDPTMRPHDLRFGAPLLTAYPGHITPERLLEENEALRQIIREAVPLVDELGNWNDR